MALRTALGNRYQVWAEQCAGVGVGEETCAHLWAHVSMTKEERDTRYTCFVYLVQSAWLLFFKYQFFFHHRVDGIYVYTPQ